MLRRVAPFAAALILLAAPAAALSPFAVFFDSGSAVLDARAREILDHAVEQIRATDVRGLSIEAAADRVGSAEANLRLSRRRAEAVRAYLLARGLPPAAIRVAAHGETGQPIVQTPDGVAEPQNRYAMVIINRVCTRMTERGLEPVPGC